MFAFDAVSPEADHTLLVSGNNYVPLKVNLNAVADKTLTYDMYLTPTANLYSVLTLTSGWNLISLNNFSAKTISATFGDSMNKIESVWAWSENKWKVYLPQKSQEKLEAYTTAKGFSILSEIPKGSGIWVNAIEALNLQIQ